MLQTNELGGDNIYIRFKVYIEGVEIPAGSFSVNSVFRELPTASISVAPYKGIETLGRNYFPKVHIFYLDPNESTANYQRVSPQDQDDALAALGMNPDGYTFDQKMNLMRRGGYKLIFSGIIDGCQEAISFAGQGGQHNIQLSCSHPFALLRTLLIRYTGLNVETSDDLENKFNVAKSSLISQSNAMMEALGGITPGGEPIERDANGFHNLSDNIKDKFDRLKGCPGSLVVLWNMLKRDVYHHGLQSASVESFKDMYIPLVETGLKLFMRMSGHELIEEALQSNPIDLKENTDPTKGTQEENPSIDKVILPPRFRTFVAQAAMTDLASSSMQGSLFQGDPDATSFYDLMMNLMNFIKYDLLVLNSPVSLVSKGGEIIETIAKPHMPYYYSPICNVLLPNMYETFSIQHNSGSVPTRVILRSTFIQNYGGIQGNLPDPSYVAPNSVRVGISNDGTLGGTRTTYNNKVGKYEWGTGIRAEADNVPDWYVYLSKEMEHLKNKGEDRSGSTGPGLDKAIRAWNSVHKGFDNFNPWDVDKSNIKPWESWTFQEADFQFTNRYAGSRVATAQSVFNPFIIVGYPMDVLDPSHTRSSYHGFCTSVSHSVDSSGYAGTTVGMAACLSYDELASCYIPMVEPWLSGILKLDEDHRIFSNEEAFKVACEYYNTVLGVGAADPWILQNYELGNAIAIAREGGVWYQAPDVSSSEDFSGRIAYHSVQGSLNLVGRNIISLPQVEKDHADKPGRTFIDYEMWDVGAVKTVSQARRELMPSGDVKVESLARGVDLERCPFLTYPGDELDIGLPERFKEKE